MRELQFDYRMTIAFELPASNHCFSFRCIPAGGCCQQVVSLHNEVTPCDFLSYNRDSFGRLYCYGRATAPHQALTLHISGLVLTGLAPGERTGPLHQVGIYRVPTPLTEAGEAVRALADAVPWESHEDGALRSAEALMTLLHARMTYAPGTTGVRTTAEEALRQGSGVCQDYAHIMLAVLRTRRIPCRYCAGLMIGEGESHAWVEVYSGGCWVAFDPTNHQLVGDSCILFAPGRDAADCAINQGVLTGGGKQTLHITATVREMTEGA